MRTRFTDQPPDRKTVDRILAEGPTEQDRKQYARLIERLRKSCYLDSDDRPLDAAGRMLEQYRRDGLALFLGAGVSLASGIPSWPSLATALLRELGLNYEEVRVACPTLISQFEFASRKSGEDRFVRALYDCLYRDLKFKDLLQDIPKKLKDQLAWAQWPEVLNNIRDNQTLEAVGELLIAADETSNGVWRANRQIHAVLTTNADNLLEVYCYARNNGKRGLLTMVDRASVGDHPGTISIYHLHGSLDARGENFLQGNLPIDLLPDLVFTESDYFNAIASPSAFVNHTPQSYFRAFNVLFIGTSLDDPNIRRWLYQSFRERKQQRAKYLRERHKHDYPDAEHEAELESLRHFWLRTATERVNDHPRPVPRDVVELSARHLGVQLVWCEDYSKLQSHIRALKTNGFNREFGRPLDS